ncbi:MAG: NAD(P)H-hydrate dehydratase [Proteobacteria bacterium]|nr:NAD(P)H-hydrate dehydratase [Pseudomonadota bacterium]
MPPLYPVAAIRQIEQAAQASLPPTTLLQRAGAAAAEAALAMLNYSAAGTAILILAGPGNNGGDALEAAWYLDRAGADVTVVLFADPAALPTDARQALARAQTGSTVFLAPEDFPSTAGTAWTLAIDGLFGIGLTRPIAGTLRDAVDYLNALSCPILSLDVPSGLDADTGNIVGPDGVAVHASRTLTFIADKPGLHTADGRDCAGVVSVVMLGIDAALLPPSPIYMNQPELFIHVLPKRAHNTHKGSYGDVAVLGGAHSMAGAPVLAARAAAHCGAGRVFAGFVDAAPAYDNLQPELMFRAAGELDLAGKVLVAGPGMGMSRAANDLLAQTLHAASAIVLDADALNLIAAEPGLQQKTAQRRAATLMTPHPLEAARLLNTSVGQVQTDRLQAACELAQRFNAVVVLKGSGSVIARPDGMAVINATGNPALATAGSGDVLAGVCGALLAQGIPVWETALAAVWLHGQAADNLVEQGVGPIGLVASELPVAIRAALNRLHGKIPA